MILNMLVDCPNCKKRFVADYKTVYQEKTNRKTGVELKKKQYCRACGTNFEVDYVTVREDNK